jgi:hypothetical protein
MRRKSLPWIALAGFCLSLLIAAVLNFAAFPNFVQRFSFAGLRQPQPSYVDARTAEAGTPATVLDASRYGSGLRRTMHLLSSSTPERRNTVRVLFYGQSITRQAWWLEVEDYLRQRFPDANLIVENRAIGGFDSSHLARVAEHDLYSFYPDLMIFHVYGDENAYETIIANARRRTTTEILLISDHVTWLPGSSSDSSTRLEEYEWHNQHSLQWLPQLANQYGCELAEIRQPWEQYLRTNNLPASTMLADNIHLNEQGNVLMANLIKSHLQDMPILPEVADRLVQTYEVGSDVQWEQDRLTLEFEGNRVDLVATDTTAPSEQDSLAFAQILIDGKPPSAFSELYTITRPTDALGTDQPAIMQVSAANPLVPERWTAVITEINDTCDRFKFKVYGSETGFDGEGQNDRPFVSESGRVSIAPQDWWLDDVYQYTKIATPTGFQIHWQVEPLFADVYVPPMTGALPSSRQAVTVAQNLPNTKHTLEVIAPNAETVPLSAIRTYHPPFT